MKVKNKNLINQKMEKLREQYEVINFIVVYVERFLHYDIFSLSAAIGFFFFFSIFSISIVLFSLLPLLDIDPNIIYEATNTYIPAELTQIFQPIINSFSNDKNGFSLYVGIILTLWSASTATHVLMKSLNKISRNRFTRGYVASRSVSLLLTLLFIVLVTLSLASYAYIHIIDFLNKFDILSQLELNLNLYNNFFSYFIKPLLLSIILIVIYRVGPDKKMSIRYLLPGTIFSFFAFGIFTVGFKFYVLNIGNFDLRYGLVSSIIILLLWFYYLSMIILAGGLLNIVIYDRKNDKLNKTVILVND